MDLDVKLVDGGVCDNQGVAGLLEQDCTVLLVSDGSGQINAVPTPGSTTVAVLGRSNDMLQARVRGTQYRELDARRLGSMLGGMMFVHLKKDLDNTPVDWTGCPPESKVEAPDERLVITRYGMPKEIQRLLAGIRTDLDSFCDQEADALMLSGYRMTEWEYPRAMSTAEPVPSVAPGEPWRFLRVASQVDESPTPKELTEVLTVAEGLFFKIWKLDPRLRERSARFLGIARALVGVLAAIVVVGAATALFSASPVGRGAVSLIGVVASVAIVAGTVIGLLLWLAARRRESPLPHFAMGLALLLLMSPAARYHRRRYEQMYLDRGRL
jgi:hypothetical protein